MQLVLSASKPKKEDYLLCSLVKIDKRRLQSLLLGTNSAILACKLSIKPVVETARHLLQRRETFCYASKTHLRGLRIP